MQRACESPGPLDVRRRSRASKRTVAWAALALLLARSAFALEGEAAAPEAVSAPDTWYAFALSSGSMGTVVVHYWSKGPKMRAETVIAGHPIVTLVDEESYTMIDILGGRGTRVARSEKSKREDAERKRPFAGELEEVLRSGGEKVRAEEVGGQSLGVFRVTNSAGRRTVWVDPTGQFPVRVETFDRKNSQTSRVDYLGWASGMPIADRFFEPPVDVALGDVSYEAFATRSSSAPVGPVPVFYGELLHGHRSN